MPETKSEMIYRKWLGICQQSDISPLRMTFADDSHDVSISVKDKLLIKLTEEEFAEMTANEILQKIGAKDE